MVLKVKRVRENGLPLPEYKTKGAAGLDLCADIDHPVTLLPGEYMPIRTGFAFEIPEGFEGQVRGRSGLAFKHGIVNYNGTIDSDYRGEVKALLFNQGEDPFEVNPGDRICQLVISPVAFVYPVLESELDESERGTAGFGSTGVS